MIIGRGMQFTAPGRTLQAVDLEFPPPAAAEVLLKVRACGVCRTDLHVADGEVAAANYPVVPGHEIVAEVVALGTNVADLQVGDRVGVGWLGRTCGQCLFCRRKRENLCDAPEFTGATRNGGFATHVLADARYCFPLPPEFDDVAAAPLLCAGLIGHRALKMAGSGETLAIYGFGAAAHIVAQVAVWEGRQVYAHTRPGDTRAQEFAQSLGCIWAGGSDESPPQPVDAAIIFAAAGELVPAALRGVRKGGRVVCGGIHMSEIPAFPYEILWGERQLVSVANLTRADALEFLELAPKVPVRTHVTRYALDDANAALGDLRHGRLSGAAVLVP